jgi:hemoglobin/transferrin/lactoferrin receptor protein
MNFKAWLYLFFIVFSSMLTAQVVVVKDATTEQLLTGVSVYNSSHSDFVYTDAKGVVDLERFEGNQVIFFRILGYQLYSILKSELQSDTILLQPKAEGLSEIIVSASKFRQNIRRLPLRVKRIDADDISMSQPQTAADLLQRSGAVFVQKSQLGGGSPMIRGFATNRVLLTVDGIRMNNAIFRGGNLQNVISIDPYLVDSTELIFGPGTVISGSDAIGGVLNFNTIELPIAPKDSLIDRTDFAMRSSSASRERTFHISHMESNKNWTGYFGFSRMNLGDLRMGRYGPESYLRTRYVRPKVTEDKVVYSDSPERQRSTAISSTHFSAKARQVVSKNVEQRMGLFYSTTSDFGRYDRLLRPKADGFRSAEWYYGPQRWLMTYWNPRYTTKQAAHQFSVAYQLFEESRYDRDFGSEIRNASQEKVNVLNLSYDNQFEISPELIVRSGVSYDANKVGSNAFAFDLLSRERTEQNSRYPDGSIWNAAAAYVSSEYQVSKELLVSGGLRYSSVKTQTDFTTNPFTSEFGVHSLQHSALTYSIGGVYKIDPQTSVRLNFSTAFRAPNIDDLAKVFDSEPGAVVVPNPGLKPEYATSLEAGIRKRFNRYFMLDGAVFYSRLVDALIRRSDTYDGASQIVYRGELSAVQSIQNAASARVSGIELSAYGHIDRRFSYRFLASFADGEEVDDLGVSSPLRHAPPFFSNTQIRYIRGGFQTILESEYNAQIRAEQLALSERSKDYMYALDAMGRPYSPSWHAIHLRVRQQWTRWQLSVAIENLFDRRYRPYSSGISAPGRQLVVALQTVR